LTKDPSLYAVQQPTLERAAGRTTGEMT